ncbi:MAG TPA: lysine-sensitive aspartokinase 3, partial [Vicinamibacterales bacterium]|nr:lysine-sensitive aspartokinase 3 [Vicinamibacterales bacterium]
RSVVMKFGGTSVADRDAIGRLIAIVRDARRNSAPPIVVVSALSGVTDRLVEIARLAEDGDGAAAASTLAALADRHATVAAAVTTASRDAVVDFVRRELAEMGGLVHALAVLREVSPRSRDAVHAIGEVLSSAIVAAALDDQGIPTTAVDARTVLVTDAEHTAAAPEMIETCERCRERIAPVVAAERVAVLGGFIGATPNGVTTTLGRGGSDYSAAIFGACLGVDEIQIWTDVDGMLTADPRIVSRPRVVPQLSFAEASELAYFGAKVLHPSTILPAVAKNIPVRILNSRKPDNAGTLITANGAAAGSHLTAIACKRDVTVVDITSTRMLMAHGFLRRLFEVFERFKTAVDVVTTSEVSVSVTVDDTRRLDALVDNLRHFAEVACEPEMAIVCAVGENLRSDATLFGRAITALDRIPLRLVSQAASRRNITFVLRDADVPAAMTRLHEAFF